VMALNAVAMRGPLSPENRLTAASFSCWLRELVLMAVRIAISMRCPSVVVGGATLLVRDSTAPATCERP